MWTRIKKILQQQGGKCIIIEDNEPAYLVMKLKDDGKTAGSDKNPDTERVNRDIAELKAEETQEHEAEDTDVEEVKIEDLPFQQLAVINWSMQMTVFFGWGIDY